MRILGIAILKGVLHLWGIRSELLRVRTKDRSYSNSSSGLLVDCDGHCSRSTASACGAVCHVRLHNLEGLATIVSRAYFDLTEITRSCGKDVMVCEADFDFCQVATPRLIPNVTEGVEDR